MSKISPCLWFDGRVEEAAKFYATVFGDVKIGTKAYYGKSSEEVSGQKAGTLMTLEITIHGLDVLLLNGGPHFKLNPSGSFFIACKDEKEIDETWKKLSEGGRVRMGLDKYPWAEKYGWTADKYGVEWQMMIMPATLQKITPTLLFVDKMKGRAEEAAKLYASIFPKSEIAFISKNEKTGLVDFSSLNLGGEFLNLMDGDGNHGFEFNEAFSLMIYCEDQKEVDFYWNQLTSDGGSEAPCGWLNDMFGVRWQIVSRRMNAMVEDTAKGDKVMAALLKMKKPDLAVLEAAARS